MYNLGRLCSYTLIGGLMGFLGMGINVSSELIKIQNLSVIISAGFILLSGLGIILNKRFISETKLNQYIKKIFQPVIAFMKDTNHHFTFSFVLGLFTGLLPCAILYPAFAVAFATGSPVQGSYSMIFFFLGSLPGMFLFGIGFQKIKKYLLQEYASITGLIIIFIGLFTIYNRFNHNHAEHGHSHEAHKINYEFPKESQSKTLNSNSHSHHHTGH
jgi:hypothetical protein